MPNLQRACVVALCFAILLTTADSAEPQSPWESWVKENLVTRQKIDIEGGLRFIVQMKRTSLTDMHAAGADLQWLPAYIGCTRIQKSEWNSFKYIEIVLIDELDGAEQGGGTDDKTCTAIGHLMQNTWGAPT